MDDKKSCGCFYGEYCYNCREFAVSDNTPPDKTELKPRGTPPFKEALDQARGLKALLMLYKCDGCHEMHNTRENWRYYKFNFLKPVNICHACVFRWNPHFTKRQEAGL